MDSPVVVMDSSLRDRKAVVRRIEEMLPLASMEALEQVEEVLQANFKRGSVVAQPATPPKSLLAKMLDVGRCPNRARSDTADERWTMISPMGTPKLSPCTSPTNKKSPCRSPGNNSPEPSNKSSLITPEQGRVSFAPLWSEDYVVELPAGSEHYESSVRILPEDIFCDVSDAINALNARDVVVEEGFCIVYSSEKGILFLLYQKNRESIALKSCKVQRIPSRGGCSLTYPITMCKQLVLLQATIAVMARELQGALTGYTMEVTESNSQLKAGASKVAEDIARSFERLGAHFGVDKIRCIRDRKGSQAFGVPKEALDDHSFHAYKLTSGGGSSIFLLQHNLSGTSKEGVDSATAFLKARQDAGDDQPMLSKEYQAPTLQCRQEHSSVDSKCTLMMSGMPGNMCTYVVKAALRRGIRVSTVALTGPREVTPKWMHGHGEVHVSEGGETIEIHVVGPEEPSAQPKALAEAKENYGDGLVVVDFTHSSVVNANIELYIAAGINFVIGTTGGNREALQRQAESSGLHAVIAPNLDTQLIFLEAILATMAFNYPGIFAEYSLKVVESHAQHTILREDFADRILKSFKTLGVDLDVGQIQHLRDEASSKTFGVPEHALRNHSYTSFTLTHPSNSSVFRFQHSVNGTPGVEDVLDAALFLNARQTAGEEKRVVSMLDVLKCSHPTHT